MDETEFSARTEPHRRELHVHCYRMLGSFEEAEDAVQETFVRAWRRIETFAGGDLFRAWLYRIATNVCLDEIRRRKRRVPIDHSYVEVPWIEPYPDRLLDEAGAGAGAEGPDDLLVARETIELTFLAALQVLPARQRAAFVARDVLGWTAAETATLLESSVAAANSAVQRARVTMQQQLAQDRGRWTATEATEQEREVLAAFIDAHERQDAEAAVAVAHQDLRITMPPQPALFEGLDVILPSLRTAFGPESDGDWRLVPTRANRMPTAACYLLRPDDDTFRAFKLDVLRVVDGKIAEITTFGVKHFPAFGLPPTL